MIHLLFIACLLLASVLFALLEIQIEGTQGWAAKLPTWRIENCWTRIFYNGKVLTGYHLYAQLFILLAAHFPFLFGMTDFSWRFEARILSFFILFWVMEDFLWFVINPAYGLRRFRPEHIAWHAPSWWWIMPREYWVFAPIGICLYLWSY